MSQSEDSRILREIERAAFHVAARVVMAKLQRRRVLEAIITPEDDWPGRVRFSRELATTWDTKHARLGAVPERLRVEQAALVLISGAVAVDLLSDGAPIFPHDPIVHRAREVLQAGMWWAAEAESCLRWLRHRAVALFACPRNWRAVAGLAQALMAQRRLGERQLRQTIEESARSKRIAGKEQFVMIDPKSSSLLEDEPNPKAHRQHGLPREPEPMPLPRHEERPLSGDGIVTPETMLPVIREFEHESGMEAAVRRLRQVEPTLMRVIEIEAQQVASRMRSDGKDKEAIAAAGAVRCGALVAELLHRAHAKLWGDGSDLLPR